MNRLLRFFLLILIIYISLIVGAGCGVLTSLPQLKVPAASRLVDAQGRLITTLYEQNRVPVTIKEIAPVMQKAIVAVEDARFYQHHGLDPIGLVRAMYRNARSGRVVEGGSTITQQLAKNLYLGPERTVSRKVKEVVLTIQLERKYTKDEILEMYLNQIYFGQGAYGIEMAARTYFNKSASQLDLAESAMLAGIPQAPSLYSPAHNFPAARERQKIVLNRMVELKMISRQEAEEALAETLRPGTKSARVRRAFHFTREVTSLFQQRFASEQDLLYAGGLTIHTTLDLQMQEAAEKALEEGLKGQDPELQGALVVLDPRNGYIKAMVGGRNDSSEYNRALAKSQPGSAMKPFLYTAAIDSGYTAASTLVCEPVSYQTAGAPPYQPEDYGGGYHNRSFTLKEALYTSDNVVAVRLNNDLGPEVMADYARRMGVKSTLRPFLSLALGTSEVTPLEMARAYGPLANGGILTTPLYVTRIVDSSGQVLEENKPVLSKVLDEKTAYIVTDMLKAVLEPGGTAQSVGASLNRPAAGKTGTTENNRDAWFVGYTPELVTAVYIGYDDKSKSVGNTGGGIAAPIWANFMSAALGDTDIKDFRVPEGVVFENICADDGLRATSVSQRTIRAAFVEGTQPVLPCIFGERAPWGMRSSDMVPAPDNLRRILPW